MPVSPASFHTPALPDTGAGRFCTPPFVLLDTYAYVTNRGNATKAAALTRTGQTIAVSFPVEPPGVSYFCVHCPGLKDDKFFTEPWVVHSPQDDVLLLGVCMRSYNLEVDFFVYRAGRHPTLQLVHGLLDIHLNHVNWGSIALVPRGDDGERFVVAAIGHTETSGQYELFLFDSEPGTSTVRVLELAMSSPAPTVAMIKPNRVTILGAGEVGFVDLWNGIIVCDVLSEDPSLRFIPLPKLLPSNNAHYGQRFPWRYRNVVFAGDGLIKCVEVEHRRRRVVHEIPDVSDAEVLYDSEFRFGAEEEEYTYENLGWRIITWSRRISSDSWHKGCLVDVDEILVSDPSHGVLFPELVDDDARRELVAGFPVMGVDGGDVVYLTCKVEPEDTKAWVVAVNMANKTVEALAPFSAERSSIQGYLNYISCALFKHLNTSV